MSEKKLTVAARQKFCHLYIFSICCEFDLHGKVINALLHLKVNKGNNC